LVFTAKKKEQAAFVRPNSKAPDLLLTEGKEEGLRKKTNNLPGNPKGRDPS